MLRPDELVAKDGHLPFYRECQCVVVWGIEITESDAVDPPVLLFDPSNPKEFHIAADSVSEFAIQMLLLNAKFSELQHFRANGQVAGNAVAELEKRFPRLPVPDLCWPPYPTRFYGDQRILLEVDGETWIWITACDQAAFDLAVQIAKTEGAVLEIVE